MMWWKFLGSIVLLVFVLISFLTGTLYLPSKSGFMESATNPMVYKITVIICLGLSILSLWQGGYGLYKRYIIEKTQ